LHGFSGPLGLKCGFWGQNVGRGSAILTPMNSFLLWGFLRLCQFWWKSIKKCDRENAHRWIHRYTDRRKPFYNLSHAICYIYGADI